VSPSTPTTARCAQCGYANDVELGACNLCGALLGPAAKAPTAPAAPAPDPGHPLDVCWDEPEPTLTGARALTHSPWFWFLVGSPLALLFCAGPFMRQWGWFLGALFHESGHTVAGLAFGLPSFPTISLAGHAATMHGEQLVAMVWLLCAALATITWTLRHRPFVCATLAIATVAYPVLAFSSRIDTVFLLGGHLGELGFATLCLHRAITGGFTHSNAERAAYSVLGWFLVGSNVALCAGLAFSPSARAWYHSSGSYGLANDYVRLADRWDGTLAGVGLLMMIVSTVPAVAVAAATALRRFR